MNFLRTTLLLAVTAVLSACGPGDASIDGDDAVTSDVESALSQSAGRFETFTARDGSHRFHLLAKNGEKVLASQGYSSAAAALAGIDSVKVNGTDEKHYLLREASDGASYFVLAAANGAIIGVSEMYSTQASATRAVTSVAQIVRLTVAEGGAVLNDPRFEVFRGLDSKYYFHLRAKNGEILLQSQGYSSKAAANGGVTSVETNGTNSARYQVLPAADGQFYFVLRAANSKIIGRGETYETQAGAQAGVSSCMGVLVDNPTR